MRSLGSFRHAGQERGSILLITILILTALTMLGLAAGLNATIESMIAGHHLNANKAFNSAEAGVQKGIEFIHGLTDLPPRVNQSISDENSANYFNVRNYGNYGNCDDTTAETAYTQTNPDGTLGQESINGDARNKYWYRVRYLKREQSSTTNPPMYRYYFLVTSRGFHHKTSGSFSDAYMKEINLVVSKIIL
jgi:Tfp pilus assembly protein PilX